MKKRKTKNVSNKKLGNVGIMSKVLANEIKVTAGNTYKIDFRIQLELISKTNPNKSTNQLSRGIAKQL